MNHKCFDFKILVVNLKLSHKTPTRGMDKAKELFWVKCSLRILFTRGVKNTENKLPPLRLIHTERKRKVSLVFVVFFFCTFDSAFSRREWTLNAKRTAVDGAGSGGAHPRGTPRTVVELPVLVRPILVVVRRARRTREVHRVPLQPFCATYRVEKLDVWDKFTPGRKEKRRLKILWCLLIFSLIIFASASAFALRHSIHSERFYSFGMSYLNQWRCRIFF